MYYRDHFISNFFLDWKLFSFVLRNATSSGVTRGLSQGGQSLAEGCSLVTVGGPLAKIQKKVRYDSESLDVVCVHIR